MIKEGDGFVSNAALIELLAIASFVLVDNYDSFDGNHVVKLWSVRCALIVQSELEEKSVTLFDAIKTIFKDLESSTDKELKPVVYLEQAKFYYTYHYIRECGEATEAAETCLGLQVADTGALGKRTKFQVKDLPQFTLNLEEQSHYTKRDEQRLDSNHLPTDLRLNDEIRLESIEVTDKDREKVRDLDSLQQSCLLSRYSICLFN
jgi:hypothetical protein